MNFPPIASLAAFRSVLGRSRHLIKPLSRKIASSLTMENQRLVWVDLEMTGEILLWSLKEVKELKFHQEVGLDIDECHIIEMACLITDENLNIVAEAPDLVIHQPNSVLEAMDEWCVKHHGESGLTAAVKASKTSLSEAQQIFLEFITKHTPAKQCALAGNSVHWDKKFLDKYMPKFMNHLHYRIVDVSTVKELCRRWYPEIYQQVPKKKQTHRALDDIKESIVELQFYKQKIFK